MRPFFIVITAILAVFIVISAHVYMGSGLFAGLFTFTILLSGLGADYLAVARHPAV